MISDADVRLAEWILQKACREKKYCNGCYHYDNCGIHDNVYPPDDWDIDEPPPEPNERQRIEWLRMLPDDEMLESIFSIAENCRCCVGCDGRKDGWCLKLKKEWLHKVVSLEQFREDVGLE